MSEGRRVLRGGGSRRSAETPEKGANHAGSVARNLIALLALLVGIGALAYFAFYSVRPEDAATTPQTVESSPDPASAEPAASPPPPPPPSPLPPGPPPSGG